jgi:hypothetical protein
MNQHNIVVTGIIGLFGAIFLTALFIFVMAIGWIPPLMSQPMLVWGSFFFLLFFSVVEIPVMIFSMRRMADSVNPRAKYVVLFTNTAYTFFAAVYAVPFIVLAGSSNFNLAAGALLASLCIVRFISSMVFLPYEKQQT